jgi:hypothetical protein
VHQLNLHKFKHFGFTFLLDTFMNQKAELSRVLGHQNRFTDQQRNLAQISDSPLFPTQPYPVQPAKHRTKSL